MSWETILENRSISAHEAEIVLWLLRNASVAGDFSHYVPTAHDLRVVGRCGCGCPSVDFIPDGQAVGARIIADAYGYTPAGEILGIILWEKGDSVSGLEFYEMAAPIRTLPAVDTLVFTPPPPA